MAFRHINGNTTDVFTTAAAGSRLEDESMHRINNYDEKYNSRPVTCSIIYIRRRSKQMNISYGFRRFRLKRKSILYIIHTLAHVHVYNINSMTVMDWFRKPGSKLYRRLWILYSGGAVLYIYCANKAKVIFVFHFHGMLHKSRGGPCFHYNSLLGPVTWVKRWNQRVILRWRVSEFRKAHLILNNAGQKGLPLKCLRAFYSLVFPLFSTAPRAVQARIRFPIF